MGSGHPRGSAQRWLLPSVPMRGGLQMPDPFQRGQGWGFLRSAWGRVSGYLGCHISTGRDSHPSQQLFYKVQQGSAVFPSLP